MDIKTEDYYNYKDIKGELEGIFNHLHTNPEISFKEYETSKYIKSFLKKESIEIIETIGTSVIGIIEGNTKGKTIALRADIDALPICENPNHSPCSRNKGVMHACGHDFHMTNLLGIAKILNKNKEKLKGRIILIFQSGEETLPGGAKSIISTGIFDKYNIEWIGAIHCEPNLEVGEIGIKSGMYMASGDEIYIDVEGPGGHAAMPHKTIDTVLTASEIVVGLQQINSRFCPPEIPSVLTFGKIESGGQMNIIPEHVKIEGTFRTMNEEWREKAKTLIKQISCGLAESKGATCKVKIVEGYPFLINSERYTDSIKKLLIEHFDVENIKSLGIRMTTEDFSYYSQKTDATFIRIGVKEDSSKALHTSSFKANIDALETSIKALIIICFNLLH
ncbi:amidohydrolase [Marinilabiliaceae bacterium JC040]|nr:amidohydrolase [Marinilabiliaceae bacterium JC040]